MRGRAASQGRYLTGEKTKALALNTGRVLPKVEQKFNTYSGTKTSSHDSRYYDSRVHRQQSPISVRVYRITEDCPDEHRTHSAVGAGTRALDPSEQLTNSPQTERTDWDILSPSLCHKFCDSTSQFQVLLDFPSTEKIPHLCIQEIFTELFFLLK